MEFGKWVGAVAFFGVRALILTPQRSAASSRAVWLQAGGEARAGRG